MWDEQTFIVVLTKDFTTPTNTTILSGTRLSAKMGETVGTYQVCYYSGVWFTINADCASIVH